MIILAYFLAFVLTFTVGALVAGIITFIPTMIHAYLYKKANSFWESFTYGGIECLVLVLLSVWVFSWFNFQLPLLFVIIITLAYLSNNYSRTQTRPNYNSELGYLVGELIGFPSVYFGLIQNDIITYTFI